MTSSLLRLKRKILFAVFLKIPLHKIRIWTLKQIGLKIGEQVYVGEGITVLVQLRAPEMNVEIGDRVSFGPNVTIVASSHPNGSRLKRITGYNRGPVTIGDDSWIGAGVIILPGITIGKGCIVGAGSVVTRNVPDCTVVVGNPARVLKKIEGELD